MILGILKISYIILANDELDKLIKKTKLETIEEVKQLDNVDGANVENFVIESEADKFLVLFEKVFKEKHIEEENITDYSNAEDSTFQDILEKIADKISKKIAIAASKNKSIKLLQLLNFFLKSFVTHRHAKSKSDSMENAEQ